ncbi:MAG: hypothetical protein H6811_10120 [Phycisphaeraceae bacterium]|nr:hypothetical protein [Phycisphaeraceae bacterium]
MALRRPFRRAHDARWAVAGPTALLLTAMVVGCAARAPDLDLTRSVSAGDFGFARSHLNAQVRDTGDRPDSEELLRLIHLGLVDLADGLAPESEPVFNRIYELLRLRGVNDNTRLAAIVTHEGVKVFRGEPFEQALAYHYVALQKAILGDWGNARAAANSALELLDEFDDVRYDRRAGDPQAPKGYQYAVEDANFALAYFMSGLANHALGRLEEVDDYFARAVALRSDLQSVADAIRSGQANTVLFVDAGLGPQKQGGGEAGSQEIFVPRFPSDGRALRVSVASGSALAGAQAQDTNLMARAYGWDDLAGARGAKALLGEGMTAAGIGIAVFAEDDEAKLAGLGLAALGLLTQATAHADTRHVEVYPQRTYVVALNALRPGSRVELRLDGALDTRLMLPLVPPPTDDNPIRVGYVRLGAPTYAARPSDLILYSSDATDEPAGYDLPWILGGRDLRTPTHTVLRQYQDSGYLLGFTLNDLLELYRLEGIRVGTDGAGGRVGRHILEGGTWLFTPDPVSSGFVRLFCREHPPYRPRSDRVRELADQIAAARRAPSQSP